VKVEAVKEQELKALVTKVGPQAEAVTAPETRAVARGTAVQAAMWVAAMRVAAVRVEMVDTSSHSMSSHMAAIATQSSQASTRS
jgi:hypothetical protein